MLIRIILLIVSLVSAWAFPFMEGPHVRECAKDEFPASTSVYLSVKGESGKEVLNGMCSGNIQKAVRRMLPPLAW